MKIDLFYPAPEGLPVPVNPPGEMTRSTAW